MVLIALVAASCSRTGDQRRFLLNKVSDEAFFVASGNPQNVLESAGGKIEDGKIVMPSYIEKSMRQHLSKRDRKEFEEFMAIRGVNFETMVFALYADGRDVTMHMMACITDQDEFTKWLSEIDFDEDHQGDFTYYTPSDRHLDELAIVIDDKVAHLIVADDNDDPVGTYQDFVKAAEKQPLADWKKERLSGADNCSMLWIIESMPDRGRREITSNKWFNDDMAAIGLGAKLDANHLSAKLELVNEKGEPVDAVSEKDLASLDASVLGAFPDDYNYIGLTSISGDLLKQNHISDMISQLTKQLVSFTLPQLLSEYAQANYDPYWGYYAMWSNPMSDRIDSLCLNPAMMKVYEQAKQMGFCVKADDNAKLNLKGQRPLQVLQNIALTGLLNFQTEAAAKKYAELFRSIEPGTVKNGATCFASAELGGDMYMSTNNGNFFLSTESSLKGGSFSAPCDLKDALLFMAVDLPRKSALVKALPVNVPYSIKSWAVVNRSNIQFDLQLSDADESDYLLENLFSSIFRIAAMASSGNSYDSDDYYDYADTIAVEEAVEAPAVEEWVVADSAVVYEEY